jgi:outer membrane protein OmpA-like peptidoglycan-associated protein
MYRLCEALQNGVLPPADYRALIKDLIDTANFIIPFEQCTGLARDQNHPVPTEIINQCLGSAVNYASRAPQDQPSTKPSTSLSPTSQHVDLPIAPQNSGKPSTEELKYNFKTKSRISLHNINFDFGMGTLRSDALSTIQQIASIMKQEATLKLRVEGYTDGVGAEKHNQLLSEQQARSVVTALVDSGVDVSRLTFAGFGSQSPIADNRSEAGRAKNR